MFKKLIGNKVIFAFHQNWLKETKISQCRFIENLSLEQGFSKNTFTCRVL